jgi:MFS transporter, DHA1 family, multidrug resistance protein
MQTPTNPPSRTEFIVLTAFMVSIVAMSTDVMLPAVAEIGADLSVYQANEAQFIITALFLGFGLGMLFAGPLSDSFGRRPIIFLGYAVFIVGCAVSAMTRTWELMILGRVLQGIGAAAPRVVTVALVRDGYAGRGMAYIMSFIMAVFVLVPMIAPAIGQFIIALSGWRQTFIFLGAIALIAAIWFAFRQPETLRTELRRPFSFASFWDGTKQVLESRIAVGYTLAISMIFGAFIAYLSTAQQVFVEAYDAGTLFPLYFAIAAFSMGFASLINAGLVMRLGMRLLSWWATILIIVSSLVFLIPTYASDGLPSFTHFILWLMSVLFCVGALFANLNALAMEPLGHIAGLGAALVGAASNFIALPLAYVIGQAFKGGVTHLVLGFLVLSIAIIVVILWTERGVPKAEG